MNRGLGDDTCDRTEIDAADRAAIALVLVEQAARAAWKPQHVDDDKAGWERWKEAERAITPEVRARLERMVAGTPPAE